MPATSSRAGVAFPTALRSGSFSVVTSTVEPCRAPIVSTSTSGSPLGEPSASKRCPMRRRRPARVSCLTVEVTVPSMRARNITSWLLYNGPFHFHRVDDSHDHGVHRRALGVMREPGRAALRKQHALAHACSHAIHGHDRTARGHQGLIPIY